MNVLSRGTIRRSGQHSAGSGGTWEGLLATPLDRALILRAKLFDAAWAVRVPLGMIAFLYLAAVASTAMHPLGFVIAVAGVSAFLWFAIALGTYVSLRSRDATRGDRSHGDDPAGHQPRPGAGARAGQRDGCGVVGLHTAIPHRDATVVVPV